MRLMSMALTVAQYHELRERNTEVGAGLINVLGHRVHGFTIHEVTPQKLSWVNELTGMVTNVMQVGENVEIWETPR